MHQFTLTRDDYTKKRHLSVYFASIAPLSFVMIMLRILSYVKIKKRGYFLINANYFIYYEQDLK